MANLVESSGSDWDRSMGAKRSGEVDRISSLPASAIQHILSFLPTKDAVATCVLSTKWPKHWRVVPKLDFKISGFPEGRGQGFVNFVNRVFLLNKAPILESVRFYLGARVDSSCLGTWMEIALDRGVKQMDISVFSLDSSRLPICLFTSKTLVTLKLTFQITLNVPPYVHFPCLKILHLVCIKYPNEESIMRFLEGCPILEDLVMSRRWQDSAPNLVISVATLKRLVLLANIGNCRKLRCNLVLNTPSLDYLDLKHMVITSCSIENLAEVSEARLEIPHYTFSKFLRSFRRIQKLSLTMFEDFDPKNCSAGCARNLTQTFHHLIYLEITFAPSHWSLVLELLRCCPKLQFLTLFKEFNSCGNRELQLTPSLPKRMSVHLKTFVFKFFTGSKHEQHLVEYILMIARSLETVKICPWSEDWEGKYRMSKNLLSLARASSACKIVFDEEEKQNKC